MERRFKNWKKPKIEEGRFKKGSYKGNKWGGKFLRAPDIFFTILKKGQGIFTTLGENVEIKRGFTTGVNDFFYLGEKEINERGIEGEFLYPVIIDEIVDKRTSGTVSYRMIFEDVITQH